MIKRVASSLEFKYALICGAIVVGVLTLGQLQVVAQAGREVTAAMQVFAGLGMIGMFVIALVANMSLLVQIPYTLPLLSAALGGASVARMMGLGVAAGVGAGIGAIVSFKLAEVLLARSPDLPRSALLQWVARNVGRRPRWTWLAVFATVALPIPDDTVIVPLAAVRYDIRGFAVPTMLGKIVHNVVVALVFGAFAAQAGRYVARGTTVDLAIVFMALFLVAIFYQAEKARRSTELALPAEGVDARA